MALRAAILAALLAVGSALITPTVVSRSGVIVSLNIREKAGRVEYDLNPEDKPKAKQR